MINHLRTCLVNLHPLFLFWKHGSVCDPEKKLGPKYGVQKAGCKKTGSLFFKKKRGQTAFSLFWITMTLFFCTLLFATHILDLFISGSQIDPCFQNKNSGCRLTGRLCTKIFVEITVFFNIFWINLHVKPLWTQNKST